MGKHRLGKEGCGYSGFGVQRLSQKAGSRDDMAPHNPNANYSIQAVDDGRYDYELPGCSE